MSHIMPTTSQYRDLNEFLAKHSAKNTTTTDDKIQHTHTRIPNQELNIYPGKYIIPREDLPTFYSLYYTHIFEKKNKEYLTEKQLSKDGPILVDFDFRYSHSTTERQYTREYVTDVVCTYLEELKQYFIFEADKPFHVYIFEKPNVNRLADGSYTKDGIHMLIGIKADHIIQQMLRETMIKKMEEYCELPLINTWDTVLDEGISKGHTNWQLFGSRKPGHEAYELTQHYVVTYEANNPYPEVDERDVKLFDLKRDFYKLSAQYQDNPSFELNPKILDEYKKRETSINNKPKKPPSKIKVNSLIVEDDDEDAHISINDIKDEETLKKVVDIFLKRLKPEEFEIKEIHDYTQALPEKYYEPGSHVLNRQVAFALKHTDERLFVSWVMLRSKASDFDYNTIPSLHAEWKKFSKSNNEGKVVTKRSIIYWVKKDNPEEYKKICNNTINYYLDKAIESNTEYDHAITLKHMYKDTFICVSYEKRGIWYKFKNHRWVQDKGLSLREKISTDLYNLYSERVNILEQELTEYKDDEIRHVQLKNKITELGKIKQSLKKTTQKDHIMREAAEIMYDENFVKNMDTNVYLLCFNNGVVDFKNKVFREGYPEDYITKTTRIDYVPCDENNPSWKDTATQLYDFMHKIFPIKDLNRYMWDHLASCLIGTNKNQTFHVYHGSGSNGKSLLVDLMAATLGDYKGTVPITLVTDIRGKIGGTSDEVLKLKGVRYAVMQEPTKGVKLNEGIMKELTGGDPIQARGLYSESEIFIPQFKLAVGTNNLFDIESNDDGTWRRIRKCTFPAKFVDEGEHYEDNTPYVHPKDKSLSEKLHSFAPVFASMLVRRAFETDGIVEECDTVLSASKEYRSGQNHISKFLEEKIRRSNNPASFIKKQSIQQEFKDWFDINQSANKKKPKGEELFEAITKKFGINPHSTKGWIGLEIIRDDPDDALDNVINGY